MSSKADGSGPRGERRCWEAVKEVVKVVAQCSAILWSAYWPYEVPVLVEIVLCDLAIELLYADVTE